MQKSTALESPFKTAIKVIGSALLGFLILAGLLTFVFAVIVYTGMIPETDLNITNVASDSVFYAGKEKSKDRMGGYLSIRARGTLDDSTARILVQYPEYAATVLTCKLPRGKFDQVWFEDYYDSRAKITFYHTTVNQGNLRLQIVFSTPPSDWNYKKNQHK